MLIANTIPNLISGVSQQPAALRLATSAELMQNAWASVITGLNKRPSTEHIVNTGWSISGSAAGHIIDKEGDYRYIVVIADGDLKVYTLDGVAQTVSFPDGKAYLTQAINPVDAFRFLTFGDTTFVMNRNVKVEADDFGETGSATYVPDGVVANVSSLPSSTVGGLVYYVSSISEYYQNTFIATVPAVTAWGANGAPTTTAPSDGNPTVTSLPDDAGPVNNTVWLQYYVYPYYYYQKYVSYETTPAVAAHYEWKQVRLSDVVANINANHKSPDGYGTVYITNSISNSFYSVYINGNLVATFLTGKGVDAASSVESTPVIAQKLYDVLTTAQTGSTSVTTEKGTTSYPARPAYTCTLHGSTISISGLIPTDTLEVTATQGDKCLKCYRDQIASFSDLPPRDLQGRVVKVKGSAKDNGDDYYVVFDQDVWVETYGYNQGAGFKTATMPHVLVRETNGTWTFKKHVWGSRNAGDATSNPHPSFVGDKLSDMFLYTNRLGFVSSSNVILSESDKFENFYRTTLAVLVDSDPLDFAVLSAMDDKLRHAIPFNKDILILADRSQHRFTYNQFVGPKNVQVQYTTSYNVSPNVRPVNMGGSVYFIDDRDTYQYAKMWEYFPKPNLTGDEATEITDPVPKYVKNNVTFLSASTRVNTAVVYSDNAPSTLYNYKFYWAGDRRIQNCWSEWTFSDCEKIYWAKFSGNYLYLLMKRSNGVTLERMRVDESMFDPTAGTEILLDRRCTPTASYNSGNDTTTFTLPYSTTADVQVVASKLTGPVDDQFQNVVLDTTKTSGSTLTAIGDWTGITLTAGVVYEFIHEFSPNFVRFAKGQGEVVALDGRLQLRYMRISYSNTSYFRAEVIKEYRAVETKVFDGKILGDVHTKLGYASPQTGKFRIPILGNALTTRIRLVNDMPFSCSFGAAEYEAFYSPRNKRI